VRPPVAVRFADEKVLALGEHSRHTDQQPLIRPVRNSTTCNELVFAGNRIDDLHERYNLIHRIANRT